MKKLFTLIVLTFLISACTTAQRATDVNSIRIPIAPYLKMTCKELATEQNQLVKDAQSMSTEVDAAYKSDKTAEIVAWILFAPAAFMIDGNQEQASKLAAVKGQLEAVQEAMKVNDCISG